MNLLTETAITAEEFLSLPECKDFELVDGKLVELHMGALSSYIAGEVFFQIRSFLRGKQLGWLFPQDTTYQCLPDRPNLVRKPDVSFVGLGRFPNERVPAGHIRLAPDLVVEVISPNDLYYEVEEKVSEYRTAGVRLIWLINPPTRSILIRHGDGTGAELNEAGVLSGENVLPGFTCRVGDLFQQLGPAAAGS